MKVRQNAGTLALGIDSESMLKVEEILKIKKKHWEMAKVDETVIKNKIDNLLKNEIEYFANILARLYLEMPASIGTHIHKVENGKPGMFLVYSTFKLVYNLVKDFMKVLVDYKKVCTLSDVERKKLVTDQNRIINNVNSAVARFNNSILSLKHDTIKTKIQFDGLKELMSLEDFEKIEKDELVYDISDTKTKKSLKNILNSFAKGK